MKRSTLFIAALLGCATPTVLTAAPAGSTLHQLQLLADPQEYVGTYKLTDLPIDAIVVSIKAGKLHYVAGEYEGDFVEVSGKVDTYLANGGQATVTFVRNAQGLVERLRMEIPDGTFEGRKEMSSLADYANRYKIAGAPFEAMVLSVKDGQLTYEAGEYKGVLVPVPNQPDVFDANGQAKVRFQRNEQKKVTKIVIDAQGQKFEGEPLSK
jgi:hypothetical protein